ncbi:UDP-4-amino-4,6-dideoxy-N-acetyl-beta-L-altrosamine N-acetyltransferase [Campylobacter sp. LR264d]|uniref:UDP-4-amino-4, 6-dideoxy-N-acetyl-beta-L-altrosamine N-acetyltransferase n=1 Tax=Campylobacter sp. LR264d TaxID=2593544 RepID=UPI00123B5ABE|nr:UDP-4-amino-4,6-dideoxy-N-acetyl-beta-L-altrosamine N-acetyltransferase [Campylobacter sp. LR264d]KAA6233560.1 UDP-4-amino-4,6-dideoxy-N-acetyl-beta-L-altrosamine N-acetyltransferase [Campylobacter sp. LR264d]
MIFLKDFTKLNRAELYLVLMFRNDKKIASFMHTKEISLKTHLEFIENLKNDKSKKYFLVFDDDEILGVIDFVNINKQSCEFGMYQNPYLKGFGAILMKEIKKYAFENLGLKNLNARVFKDNERALTLYLKHGFKIIKKDENMIYLSLNGGGLA